MFKIIIVEDQIMLRDMIKDTLLSEKNFYVVGSISSARDIIPLCETLNPDIVLMDVCTDNNSNGIFYGGEIKKLFSNIKVVIMTGMPEINFINQAKNLKIDSFIYKTISKDSLIQIIKNTLDGYSTYPDESNKKIENNYLSLLTEKELDILALYCKLLDRDLVAKELNISLNLTKNKLKPSLVLEKAKSARTTEPSELTAEAK